jgi:kynurenine formamidase
MTTPLDPSPGLATVPGQGDGLRAEFNRYLRDLSNWNRWGPDDDRGTLNLLTPDATVSASRLVQSGRAISCSRRLAPRPTTRPGSEYLHKMASSGEGAPAEGEGFGADWFAIGFHGYEHTHLDSHAHLFWNASMYNGVPASQCRTAEGALSGGVEAAFSGIAGRALLFDAPAARGVPHLHPGEAIRARELDEWFAAQSLVPRDGDMLWVRTGRDQVEEAGGSWDQGAGSPGLDLDCLPWLHQHGISVLLSDVANEVRPSPVAGVSNPLHVIAIVAMGMWLVDNADLGALARECRAERRYAFFSLVTPLALRRATGSPVNPIAMF